MPSRRKKINVSVARHVQRLVATGDQVQLAHVLFEVVAAADRAQVAQQQIAAEPFGAKRPGARLVALAFDFIALYASPRHRFDVGDALEPEIGREYAQLD